MRRTGRLLEVGGREALAFPLQQDGGYMKNGEEEQDHQRHGSSSWVAKTTFEPMVAVEVDSSAVPESA